MSQIGRELIEINSDENQNKIHISSDTKKEQKSKKSHKILKMSICLFLVLLLTIMILLAKNTHEKGISLYADKGLTNNIIVNNNQKEILKQILLQKDNGKNQNKEIKYELILRATKDNKEFSKVLEMGSNLDGSLCIVKTTDGYIFGGISEFRFNIYPDREETKDFCSHMENLNIFNFLKNKICIGNFNNNFFYRVLVLHDAFEIKEINNTLKMDKTNFEVDFEDEGVRYPFDELELYKIEFY